MPEPKIVFERVDGTDIAVRDTVSGQQYVFNTTGIDSLSPATAEQFPAPVTRAVTLDVSRVRIPEFYSVTVRDEAGEVCKTIYGETGVVSRESGRHFLEIDAPVKTYVRIDGPFEYTHSDEILTLDCEQTTAVTIGARAWQCAPQETITTTGTPEDLIDVLSYFGDAVMTDSPERSFPTLRGYPPEITVGDRREIPDGLSKPDTGITVTVPPEYGAVLSVAPLAYYLRATVEPGDQFTIRTQDGFTHSPQGSVSQEVKRVLSTCFYLDCLVRTEGLYPVDLHERRQFETATDQDWEFATLYDESLAARTSRYLQADPSVIDAVTPEWSVTAVVEPTAASAASLPYILPELALVRPADPPRYTGDDARKHVVRKFAESGQPTRSTSLVFDEEAAFVDVPETESQQTLWVGDDIPLNAGAVVTQGYRNQRPNGDDSSAGLSVMVVCNETEMQAEQAKLQQTLDPRGELPIEIDAAVDVSTRQLREILADGADYLHFIGHARPEGLKCADGFLDVETVPENNVSIFFLNACQSFQQGSRLVENGSLGGLVTFADVSNELALETGSHLVQLLNYGFPLGACHNIISQTTAIGGQYTVVGNSAAIFSHHSDGIPYLRYIDTPEDGDSYQVRMESFTGGFSQYKTGSIVSYLSDTETVRLVPSTAESEVDEATLDEMLSTVESPVVVDGRLQHAEDVL